MAFNEASESTRREYAARMNRVVDHIQTHLDVPLDLEQLALRASAPSTSIASSMHVDETLQAFVNRLLKQQKQIPAHIRFRGCDRDDRSIRNQSLQPA